MKMEQQNGSSAGINVVQEFIDKVAGKGDEKALRTFMQDFLGNPTRDNGPGVLSSFLGFRFDGKNLNYIEESTRNGYHEEHSSEHSVRLTRAESSNTTGWIPFTRALDESTGTRFKIYDRIKPCKHVYVKTEKVWYKSYGVGFDTPAPGQATFLVMNPPGLKGWYQLVYTLEWD